MARPKKVPDIVYTRGAMPMSSYGPHRLKGRKMAPWETRSLKGREINKGYVAAAAVAGLAVGTLGYLLYKKAHSSKKIGSYNVTLNNNLRGQSELHLSGPGVNVHKKLPTKEAVPLYASIKSATDIKQIALS